MRTITFYPDDFRNNKVGMTWNAFLLSLGVDKPDQPRERELECVTLHVMHTHLDFIEEESEPDPGEMDGDHASALASVGWGTDEDYGGGCEQL